MKISQEGIDFIKKWEGCRLDVYLDSIGLPTVGVGHMDKSMVVGDMITQDQADELLREDLDKFEKGVSNLVKIQIKQCQFDALVSFAFNVGLGNLASSTLLKRVNVADPAAGSEFLRWGRAGGKLIPGLLKRRQAEKALFES